jgi:haloalkane dehalogenase
VRAVSPIDFAVRRATERPNQPEVPGMTAEPIDARPPWLAPHLFPFRSRFAEVDGARVHYVDEGSGPPLLLLHGNPTWSFLYREVISGLRDRFRCIAPDYPGFGLSTPAPGYRFTPAEHARIVERLVLDLDLRGITMMVQDWGGPIGFAVATRHPERFARFVVGNTWAWPKSDPGTQAFSRLVGGPIGRRLIASRNIFVERILPGGVKRRTLPPEVMAAYRGPFPTPASRRPVAVLPGEILASRPFLADVESRLPAVSERPALILWPTRDPAFGARERARWEALFAHHETTLLEGAGHYIQEDAAAEIVAAIRAAAATA